MNAYCCVCGAIQSIVTAIKTEEERRQMIDKEGTPIPTLGIVCESCQNPPLSVKL